MRDPKVKNFKCGTILVKDFKQPIFLYYFRNSFRSFRNSLERVKKGFRSLFQAVPKQLKGFGVKNFHCIEKSLYTKKTWKNCYTLTNGVVTPINCFGTPSEIHCPPLNNFH